jgi:hypothetical protein
LACFWAFCAPSRLSHLPPEVWRLFEKSRRLIDLVVVLVIVIANGRRIDCDDEDEDEEECTCGIFKQALRVNASVP